MLIRPCKLSDAEAAARLATELGYPTSAEQARTRLARLLPLAGHALFAAELDGQTIGWVHVHAVHLLESAPFAEIAGLVVAASHRGTGVGKALVGAALSWASGQGLAKVRVRSNVVRTAAHHFYEALGFQRVKTQVVFDRPSEP